MKTADQWAAILAPEKSWREAYPPVANAAADILRLYDPHVSADSVLSTNELVEKLWPLSTVNGLEQVKARQRVYQALKAMATRELADWCRRGEPHKARVPQGRNGGFKTIEVRPWLWSKYGSPHAEAVARPTCPHCGGQL